MINTWNGILMSSYSASLIQAWEEELHSVYSLNSTKDKNEAFCAVNTRLEAQKQNLHNKVPFQMHP